MAERMGNRGSVGPARGEEEAILARGLGSSGGHRCQLISAVPSATHLDRLSEGDRTAIASDDQTAIRDDVYELLGRKSIERAGRNANVKDASLIVRAYRQTSDTMRRFLDVLAEHPGELVGAGEMQRELGLTNEQFRGHLGGFDRLWTGPLKQPAGTHWFFDAWGSGEGGTMEYRATEEVAGEIRRAKEEFDRSKKR